MTDSLETDIRAIQSLDAVPTILQMIAEESGLRFVCVARVTPDSWTACEVLDNINFNLLPGDQLDVCTTLCDEVRASQQTIIIDKVSDDPVFVNHATPRLYGFESYFSVPIFSPGGDFFGTLCGLDPEPSELTSQKFQHMITSFAGLISRQLETEKRLSAAEHALQDEKEMATLREQYIAILGHDLRTPLSSITMGIDVLKLLETSEKAKAVLGRMENSSRRISILINNMMDFTHGRMGNGIPLHPEQVKNLTDVLEHTIAELTGTYKEHTVITDINLQGTLICDPARMAQLLSNLLINALIHGDATQPVQVAANCQEGLFSLSVANGGEAIPKDTLARLFQPFWRAPGQASSEGLGLGLFIASEIARAYNGTLEVQSDSEQTVFTFTAEL